VFQVDQQRISALDTIMMTIRGWTVTLVAAIVGFSLSQHHRDLLLVAMVGAVLSPLVAPLARNLNDPHYKFGKWFVAPRRHRFPWSMYS
jgi:uncharacterized membrane protein